MKPAIHSLARRSTLVLAALSLGDQNAIATGLTERCVELFP